MTISLASGLSPPVVTQGADQWLQVSSYVDAVFYLDVKQPGSGVSINYQTAPRREDSAFVTMLSILLTAGTRADPVLAKFAQVPLAKYVRWQLSGAGSSATFRVWLATNSLG